jgi:hypothetical protein
MATQNEPRNRKPSDGRPVPRRFFSFDSTKTSNSGEEPVPNNKIPVVDDRSGHGRTESVASTIREDGDPFATRAPTPQALQTPPGAVGAPSEFNFLPKTSFRAAEPAPTKSTSKFRLNRPPPISSHSKSTAEATIPPSPSKLRWDQLRTHVLPSHGSTSSLSSFVPPSRESAGTPTTGRSTPTPKPSRLAARFGFKHVVDSARANVSTPEPGPSLALSEPSAFEKELRLACWTARYGPDVPIMPSAGRPGHMQREPTQTTIASLWPLMSSSNLTSNAAASASTLTLTSTVQSKPSPSRGQGPLPVRHPPSVAQLHSTLISHASSADHGLMRQIYLPMEPEILAALLLPFFPQTGPALASAEEERALAMESFEVLSKTWPPTSPENELDRALWICRAASLSLPTSSVRSHLVGILYSAFFPRGREFEGAGTPSHLRTLVLALLRLQATFVDPASGRKDSESSEARLLDDLFTQVTSEGFTQLDRDSVAAEYGLDYGNEEDHDAIRHAVVCSAFMQSLGCFARRKRQWVVELIKVSALPLVSDALLTALIRMRGIPWDQALPHYFKESGPEIKSPF